MLIKWIVNQENVEKTENNENEQFLNNGFTCASWQNLIKVFLYDLFGDFKVNNRFYDKESNEKEVS